MKDFDFDDEDESGQLDEDDDFEEKLDGLELDW